MAPENSPTRPVEMNATMTAFGDPKTLIADYRWWRVLVRPKQVTLGSLVLAAKSDVTAFSALPKEAFAGLAAPIADIESTLTKFCSYQKINYLMLMMVDREVHYHVIPRYEGAREFEGAAFPDTGWPGPPKLADAVALDHPVLDALVEDLRALWPK